MTKITISHTFDADKCLTKEIQELNNKYNILTLYSCCGHEKGNHGFIIVHEFCEDDMVKLGYEKNGHFATLANGHANSYSSFRAKSVCKGHC